MKRTLALVAAILLFAHVGGCGDSHESLAAEQVSTMNDFVATMDTVKDVDSAKAAKPKLKSLMEKMTDVQKRMEKLPAPTEAQVKAMDAKYGKQMEEAARKMQASMFKVVSDPRIAAELQDIQPKVGKGG